MEVGLYGKLPSHGDFLRRRTSDAFVDRWDGWLQGCMAASRSKLGDKSPVCWSITMSGVPPVFIAAIGRPSPLASINTRLNDSGPRDGKSNSDE